MHIHILHTAMREDSTTNSCSEIRIQDDFSDTLNTSFKSIVALKLVFVHQQCSSVVKNVNTTMHDCDVIMVLPLK